MDVEFDPVKDAANIAKHGVSLAKGVELEVLARIVDPRFDHELRLRAYGLIDGVRYCLAYTLRGDRLRAISLRRVHFREYRRYVP